LIKSVSDADPTKMSLVNAFINELVNTGIRMGDSINKEKILSNSKAIVSFMNDVVETKFPKDSPIIDKFSGSVLGLKKSFKELDDVLIKEDEKRKKALDDFQARLKVILETIVNSKDALDSFNTTITNMTNYQPPAYQPTYQQQEDNNYGAGVPYAPEYQPNGEQQGGNNKNNIDISGALADVLSQVSITPSGSTDTSDFNTEYKDIAKALMRIAALKYQFNVDIPSKKI
jgi:hypothetical protein